MDNLLLAYMAGIVDGEGSISIVTVHRTKQYVPRITVSNCNYGVIDLFVQNFGGKIRTRKHKSERAKNWKTCYEWSVTVFKAYNVICLLIPYLRIKTRQAVIVGRAAKIKKKYNRSMMRWHPELRPKVNLILAKLKDECKRLNKRGVTKVIEPC